MTKSIIGVALSTLVIVALLADAGIQLFAPALLEAEMKASGFSPDLSMRLGLITLVCTLLYAIPRTAMLGAIMITGFLGGAIAVHFRLGEFGSPPQIICLLLGAATWAGLYLRDLRVRALLPTLQAA